MKFKRIISAFLTLVMLLGSMVVSVDAAWSDKVDEKGDPIINYLQQVYATPEEKLADMILVKKRMDSSFTTRNSQANLHL